MATWQLRGHVSEDELRRRVASGALHREYRGVYAVGRPGCPPDARRIAAVLACGPHAVLSFRALCHHLELLRGDGPRIIDVTDLHAEFEKRFHRFVRRGPWPACSPNVLLETPFGPLRLDAYWREFGFGLELDSWAHHQDPSGSLTLELRAAEQDVEIICGPARFHLRTLRTEDFPPLPDPGGDQVVHLPAKAFTETIAKVARSASRDETRPILAEPTRVPPRIWSP